MMKGKHKKVTPQNVVNETIEEVVEETVDEVEDVEDNDNLEEEVEMKKTNQKQEQKNPKNNVNTKPKGKEEEDDEEDEDEGMPLWKKIAIGAGIALLAGGGIAFGVHQAKKKGKKHRDYSDDYLCIDADDRPLLPNRPDYRGASEEPDMVIKVTD